MWHDRNGTAQLQLDVDWTMHTMQEYVQLIGETTNDADAARLAEEAINAPLLFFYGTLFELPSVQRLRSNPSFVWIPQVMEVLCYGMVDELRRLPGSVQAHLTPLVYEKMNKLSVLSLCGRDDMNVGLCIRTVQETIGAAMPLEAEELLIDMMSDGLLRGRIDQRGGTVVLQEFEVREVRREDVAKIREKLEAWCCNCDTQLEMLAKMMGE
ncbi:COP9 signalosome complex subunit 7, variant [Trypanosoma rangeli]|uniref:COP9 signalosome complex subunit 7, variant n=1 Tax=Trypanosoma rangeli TaxID=5698 RepID=A0A3R7KB37_TRYRA|nr:COP9 signalosome complex subunit 7, variant [Trypanosoma rangeli]RNF03001.1 COP9 signalosome complex subunit 7, variant [Trypanosoma rangeli]|eukprot:RNF03001.1 COP9 signalosome complex subunit 7, variant [Trypanosoma rangeli]